nr:MAG TPA: hypothetical protein [Caudoviricetes sp.]
MNFSACTEGRKNFSRKFVKTYRPSPKRSRGKKISKIMGQTGI